MIWKSLLIKTGAMTQKVQRFAKPVTGTRYLSDEGKQAIDEMFERSFNTSDK